MIHKEEVLLGLTIDNGHRIMTEGHSQGIKVDPREHVLDQDNPDWENLREINHVVERTEVIN